MEITLHSKSDYLRLLKSLQRFNLYDSAIGDDSNCMFTVYCRPPENVEYYFTDQGRDRASSYIAELKAKQKEILDAKKDTADETDLPTLKDILDDIKFIGLDGHGEYYNSWGVTNHYDADWPLFLKLGRDFLMKEEFLMKQEDTMRNWKLYSILILFDHLYGLLYDGKIAENSEMIEAGLKWMRENPDKLNVLAAARRDMFVSDREINALALALNLEPAGE